MTEKFPPWAKTAEASVVAESDQVDADAYHHLDTFIEAYRASQEMFTGSTPLSFWAVPVMDALENADKNELTAYALMLCAAVVRAAECDCHPK